MEKENFNILKHKNEWFNRRKVVFANFQQNTHDNNIFTTFRKQCSSKLRSKYRYPNDNEYNIHLINQIIENKRTKFVTKFKEYLISNEPQELLWKMFKSYESRNKLFKLGKINNYSQKLYPSYASLSNEIQNIIYLYLQNKQRLIDYYETNQVDTSLNYLYNDQIFNSEFFNSIARDQRKDLEEYEIKNKLINRRTFKRDSKNDSYHSIEWLIKNIGKAELQSKEKKKKNDDKMNLQVSSHTKDCKQKGRNPPIDIRKNPSNLIYDNLLITASQNFRGVAQFQSDISENFKDSLKFINLKTQSNEKNSKSNNKFVETKVFLKNIYDKELKEQRRIRILLQIEEEMEYIKKKATLKNRMQISTISPIIPSLNLPKISTYKKNANSLTSIKFSFKKNDDLSKPFSLKGFFKDSNIYKHRQLGFSSIMPTLFSAKHKV